MDQQEVASSENVLTADLGSLDRKERDFQWASNTLIQLFIETECALFTGYLQRAEDIADGVGHKLRWQPPCFLVSQ